MNIEYRTRNVEYRRERRKKNEEGKKKNEYVKIEHRKMVRRRRGTSPAEGGSPKLFPTDSLSSQWRRQFVHCSAVCYFNRSQEHSLKRNKM
jgi:hypothetical protein